MSSKGIEPFLVYNDKFFYREPPLPFGAPALFEFILFSS